MRKIFIAIVASATLLLAACAPTTGNSANKLTVAVHDSVAISAELLAAFKTETGIEVTLVKAGDAGAMTNKLVLTKTSPIADAVYGIDNTFSGVALDNGVIDGKLTAIDYGDVCFNYDKTWFATHEQAVPTSIEDLTKAEFRGLTVVENPTSSSTGLAFLTATISRYGALGWQQYWQALKNNDVKVVAGWEDAYFTDFSGSSGKGEYPIVLSYSSSPASEVRDNGESQTETLDDGCYRQTEYAGVLTGSKNKDAAGKFIQFLLGQKFQESLPGSMYVYPIVKGTKLPEAWAAFAKPATSPIGGELDVNNNREGWLKLWSAIFD